ncbi:MAG: hypothetical protein L6Q76_16295 [Polyangiaceae bacterium]|nr:hypothetical protein [Polyangiaceae bacterium]
MSAPRPADRARRELRRTVDKDGVVRVELGSGGGARRAWLGAGAAILVLSTGAAWIWLYDSSRNEPSGRAQTAAPQRFNTKNNNSNSNNNNNTKPRPRADRLPLPGEIGDRAAEGGATSPDPESPEFDENARDDAQDGDDPGRGADFDPSSFTNSPERTGIGAFPAPGTKRIKSGIVVPDDFQLPPGYVRHFQATDKGQMLQPILMFHPDYQPLDEAGKPIPIPPDRVVPEELAPPGLAVEYLAVPADAYADSDAPEEGGEEGGGGAP